MKNFILSTFLFLTCAAAFGQTGVTISGNTQDQTGAVIPNESVTLTNKATAQAVKTTSNDEGRFTFNNVAPGEYVLRAKVKGFKAAEVPVTVRSKPVTGVALTLLVGDVDETVNVSATASQPSAADNNADSVQVNSDLIDALPLQSQDLLPLINNFVSPAATGTGLSIVVDGIEGTDLTLPTDSVKRIHINKNPYSPEFRRPGLGRVEVTTRNGSRGHFDGTFASHFRNDALDATNAFATDKPSLHRDLFEATLGGPFPIRHARFFVSASRLMDNETAIVNATTPQGQIIQNVPTQLTTTTLLGRLDLRPNSFNTISLIYNYLTRPGDDRGVGGLRLPEHQTSRDDRRHKGQLWYTSVISPTVLNVARFNYEQRNERDGFFPLGPEIDVEGAFVGGFDQSAQTVAETKMEFQDVLSYTRGINTWRFGGSFRPRHFTFTDASNFGGTFTFPDLPAFSAGQPNLFQQIQANPNLSFRQNEAYGFVQDDMRLGQHVSLMTGLRYDWQQLLNDHNNLAPRVALGVSPGKGTTVFRVGAGIFYDRLPDDVTEQTLLLNGIAGREFVVRNPAFTNPSLAGVAPSVWLLAPDLQAPYLIQASASVEQSLWKTLRGTIEYQHLRGVHLFRARDINSPFAGGVRPDPAFFLERQVESTASLKGDQLMVSLQGRVGKPLKIKTQYTFSNTKDDTDGALVLPADSRNLAAEWGRSAFDVRHRFTLTATTDLAHRFRLGSILTAQSGLPFNITTGDDNNRNGVVNDRPAGVARNSGNGPGLVQLDLRLAKTFYIFGGQQGNSDASGSSFTRLELSLDAFNVFNHPNLTNVIGVVTSPHFGLATTALQPRTLQISAKIVFRGNME